MCNPPFSSLPYVTTLFRLHASDLSLFNVPTISQRNPEHQQLCTPAGCLRVSTATLSVTCSTVGRTADQAEEGLALTPRSSVSWGGYEGPPFLRLQLASDSPVRRLFYLSPWATATAHIYSPGVVNMIPTVSSVQCSTLNVVSWTRRGGNGRGTTSGCPHQNPTCVR